MLLGMFAASIVGSGDRLLLIHETYIKTSRGSERADWKYCEQWEILAKKIARYNVRALVKEARKIPSNQRKPELKDAMINVKKILRTTEDFNSLYQRYLKLEQAIANQR